MNLNRPINHISCLGEPISFSSNTCRSGTCHRPLEPIRIQKYFYLFVCRFNSNRKWINCLLSLTATIKSNSITFYAVLTARTPFPPTEAIDAAVGSFIFFYIYFKCLFGFGKSILLSSGRNEIGLLQKYLLSHSDHIRTEYILTHLTRARC